MEHEGQRGLKMLLALKTEEGATSQGMQVESKETDLLDHPEGTQPFGHRNFTPVKATMDFQSPEP